MDWICGAGTEQRLVRAATMGGASGAGWNNSASTRRRTLPVQGPIRLEPAPNVMVLRAPAGERDSTRAIALGRLPGRCGRPASLLAGRREPGAERRFSQDARDKRRLRATNPRARFRRWRSIATPPQPGRDSRPREERRAETAPARALLDRAARRIAGRRHHYSGDRQRSRCRGEEAGGIRAEPAAERRRHSAAHQAGALAHAIQSSASRPCSGLANQTIPAR